MSEKKCGFVHIWANNCKPYKKYQEISKRNRETKIPMLFCQLRWDGSFGAPGGKIEEGETVIQGVVREVEEEIDYKLDTSNLIPLTVLQRGEYEIHSYSYEVSFEELNKIRCNATNATHSLAECSGYNLIHLENYAKEKGLPIFLRNQFCATAKEEITLLLEEISKNKTKLKLVENYKGNYFYVKKQGHEGSIVKKSELFSYLNYCFKGETIEARIFGTEKVNFQVNLEEFVEEAVDQQDEGAIEYIDMRHPDFIKIQKQLDYFLNKQLDFYQSNGVRYFLSESDLRKLKK